MTFLKILYVKFRPKTFSLLIKKTPFINFLPKKQRIYDYFYEFASEALHIVIFENIVKSMTSCLSKLKVIPSFCFAFKIPDNVTETTVYVPRLENIQFLFLHGENGFVIKGTELYWCKGSMTQYKLFRYFE